MAKPITGKALVIGGSIIVLIVAAFLLTWVWKYSRYQNADFKSYVKARSYCDGFYGGTNESQEQLYKDWRQSGTAIGC